MTDERYRPPSAAPGAARKSFAPLATSLRILSVPLLVFACFWLYGNAMAVTSDILIPYIRKIPRSHQWLIGVALAIHDLPVALIGAALLSYPVTRLYGRRSFTVALFIVAPAFLMRLYGSWNHWTTTNRELILWGGVITLALPLICGVIYARRRQMRSSPSSSGRLAVPLKSNY